MQKHLSLSLAAAVTLSGCSAFQSSPTWKTVVENRASFGSSAAAKDEYADRLHTVLAAEHVEHKVVTYQYRYRTRLREEAVNAASAVIYRDNVTPDNPWWIMDDTLSFPVWLPNGDISRQLSFYLRRSAEVLAEKDYAGDSDHKSLARLAPKAPRLQVAQAAQVPRQPKTKALPAVAKTRASTRQLFATAQPVRLRVQPKGTPAPKVVKIAKASKTTVAAHRPGTRQAPVSSRLFPAPKRTVWVSGAQRPSFSQALAEPRYTELFRARNGTRYDPSSPVDREKMVVLRQAFFQRHTTAQLR